MAESKDRRFWFAVNYRVNSPNTCQLKYYVFDLEFLGKEELFRCFMYIVSLVMRFTLKNDGLKKNINFAM